MKPDDKPIVPEKSGDGNVSAPASGSTTPLLDAVAELAHGWRGQQLYALRQRDEYTIAGDKEKAYFWLNIASVWESCARDLVGKLSHIKAANAEVSDSRREKP